MEGIMNNIFIDVKEDIKDAYRRLEEELRDDGTGLDQNDPEDKMSAFNILYGHEAREIMNHLRLAMMWLREAEESVG